MQFVVLGSISVALNTTVDIIAVLMAASLRDRLVGYHNAATRLRKASAALLGGIGVSVLLTRRPA